MINTYVYPIKIRENKVDIWRIKEIDPNGLTLQIWDFKDKDEDKAKIKYQKLLEDEAELIKAEFTESTD